MEGFDVTRQELARIRNNLEKMVGTSYGQMYGFLNNLRPSDYDDYSLQVSFLYDIETGDIPWFGRKGEEDKFFVNITTTEIGILTLSWNEERYRIVNVDLEKKSESAELVIVKSIVEYNETYGF